MMAAGKAIRRIPVAGRIYSMARRWLRYRGDQGRREFRNFADFVHALEHKGPGAMELETFDGLRITVRRNQWDARIVREIFVDQPYVRHVVVPSKPVVVDIGGYIGDFTLFAAKRLDASRVIVYEPTPENFEILLQNVTNNGFRERVEAVNKAVSNSPEITLNVEQKVHAEIHASAYWYEGMSQRKVAAATLAEIVEEHHLDRIDLLKIDCEGGEYDIIPDADESILRRVSNIVFEFHRFPGYEARLQRVLQRLTLSGFSLTTSGHIVSATRA